MAENETAKDRYTRYFYDELKAHPDVPPARKVISERMGWKSPNHSGDSPTWRRDLLTETGFVLINGRYHKGVEVTEHNGIHAGQKIWFRQKHDGKIVTGRVDSITVAADGKKWGLGVMKRRVDANGEAHEWGVPCTPADLVSFPDRWDLESIEQWLASDGPAAP